MSFAPAERAPFPSKETAGLALSFAQLSKNDLDASKLLFQKGLFALAIFHLQQAVEKAAKAVGLMVGLVKSKDNLTKEVGHRTLLGLFIQAPTKSKS